MEITRDYQVNARISLQAGHRLKLLAKNRRQSFGEILDALIMQTPLATVDWQLAIDELAARVAALETAERINPVAPSTQPETEYSTNPEPAPRQDEPEADQEPQEPAEPVKRVYTAFGDEDLKREFKKPIEDFIKDYRDKERHKPSLEQLRLFCWNQLSLGQTNQQKEIVAMNKVAMTKVLERTGLRVKWEKLN